LINAGEIRVCLRSLRTDADGVSLSSNTKVSEINIVVACGEIATGEIAQRDVVGASCIIHERIVTIGRVAVAGCTGKERNKTYCRVVRAGCQAEEGISALSSIVAAVASIRWWRQLRLRCRRKRESSEHKRYEK